MNNYFRQGFPAFLFLLISIQFKLQAIELPSDLSFDFIKHDITNMESSGVLNYSYPGKINIMVKTPINQEIRIEGTQMIILYPDRKKCFFSENDTPFPEPMTETIFSLLKPDYGLSEIGFVMKDVELIKDTTITHWEPEIKSESFISAIILKTFENRIYHIEILNEKNSVIQSVRVGNYTNVGFDFFFPDYIEDVKFDGDIRFIEKYFFNNFEVNQHLDKATFDLLPPQGYEVEELQW